jgi:hypothetical protein
VIDVDGDGVAAHGAQGMSLTLTPASAAPVASLTTVPDAFVVALVVGVCVGVAVGGVVVPPPPPQAARSAVEPRIAPIINLFKGLPP